MFTGIIEELGQVKEIKKENKSAKIKIAAKLIPQDLKLGDSVAVNGVCLTIVSFSSQDLTAEVMAETLDKSSLGLLRAGERVNLERALRADSRFGGHIVSGHVDGRGQILSVKEEGIAQVFKISYPKELAPYLAKKGSIAVDGISLTLVDVLDDYFIISLIPHSLDMTTLGFKREKDLVNLEIDILARYIERLLQVKNTEKEKPALTESFLLENGFI